MTAYLVSYTQYEDDIASSTNLVWAEDYSKVQQEFNDCAWFAAHVATEGEVKTARDKGMPERWLMDDGPEESSNVDVKCPICGEGDEVEYGHVYAEGDMAWHSCTCLKCGAFYTATYKFEGIETFEED